MNRIVQKVSSVWCFLSVFSLFFISVHAEVGPVIPGQSLWCINKSIAGTVDIIESKVCQMDSQLDVIESKIDAIPSDASQLDVIESKIDVIDVTVDFIESKVCEMDSQLDVIESKIDALDGCGPRVLTAADISAGTITLGTPGNYCLSTDLTADIDITANCVTLDLNHRCLTGVISITSDDVLVQSGNVTPPAPTSAPDAAITIDALSDRARLYDVLIICADTTADGVVGRAGIQVQGNDTQILQTTIKSGAGESTGITGTNGGVGILVTTSANNAVIRNCIVSTGDGGNGTTTGGSGGNGITVNGDATETEIIDTTILYTGNGGNGSVTTGSGGHGVFIDINALDTVLRNCTIRNTGASGVGGGSGGVAGKAVLDYVTAVANLSMVYSNFAHNIANAIKYDLQGLGTEQGVALANPPTATVVNPFANVFVS